MVNKRLLVKNLLAHNDENSFYDKKRKLNISEKEGKAKFLKHVCALANSNPNNNSFIVIGVEDEDNRIDGVDFFDDSKIQNLINAYLTNPPIVSYENIPFPHLPVDKVVGLVTIRAQEGKICSLRKNIWKYYGGSVFFREGSMSLPKVFDIEIKDINSETVAAIENHARNHIELTLDGVFDFVQSHKDYNPSYKVFKEYFVVCWAGKEKKKNDTTYFSRVDIALVNEQVKLFYSNFDEVSITITDDYFKIIEYVQLGIQQESNYYPLEEVTIYFRNNMTYDIESTLLFDPPQYDKKSLYHLYNANNTLVNKLQKKIPLTQLDKRDLEHIPSTYLICYLNGFEEAKEKLEAIQYDLKTYDARVYDSYKEVIRILRKVRYN